MKLALTLLAFVATTLAAPAETAEAKAAAAAAVNIKCSKAVSGVLQLVQTEPEGITRTGASFTGPLYPINGVQARLLKIFAPRNYEVSYHVQSVPFLLLM
jgi:hypothetical protein